MVPYRLIFNLFGLSFNNLLKGGKVKNFSFINRCMEAKKCVYRTLKLSANLFGLFIGGILYGLFRITQA
jgi:hypothetical protein